MLDVLTFLALLGSGLMAGAFFAFSTFVMKALARLPAAEGIAAMQSINIVVINPLFLGVFVGTAAACAATALWAGMGWEKPGAGYAFCGAMLYLFGTFGVTMVFNVPLNNALEEVAPANPDAARVWNDYVRRWTRWNHVRAAAAAAALAAFFLAARA